MIYLRTGERSEKEAAATRSMGCPCSCCGGWKEVEVGVWGDAGESPLEDLEQREFHVPDRRRPERMTHYLLHLLSRISDIVLNFYARQSMKYVKNG